MEALPAAMDLPPGAVIFCQTENNSAERGKEKKQDVEHRFVLTLHGLRVCQKTDYPGQRCSHQSPTSHQVTQECTH